MTKLTTLPAADALTGDEAIPVVQGGATKRTTYAELRDPIISRSEEFANAAQMAADNLGGVATFLRAIAFYSEIYAHAITDDSGLIIALVEKATGKLKLALADDSVLPSGLTLSPIDASTSGWLLPVLDANGLIVGGWRSDGSFVANLSPDSILPAGTTLPSIEAALAAANMGVPTARLFASGDSLTAGAGGGGTTAPDVFAAAMAWTVYNSGVGGTKSGSIGVRQGGIAMNLTLAADLPAAVAEVDVAVYSEELTNNQSAQAWNGTLAGIPVVLTRYGAADPSVTLKYTVTRQVAAGAATAIPPGTRFIPDSVVANELDYHWIEAGRNDVKATRADRIKVRDNILAMIDRIKHDRFLIIPVKNGGAAEGVGTAAYDQIMDTNRLIDEAVGWHFCDTRSYLASYDALADAGLAATAQDDADIAGDGIPVSLRFDGIHGNASYYTIEGQFAARWARGHGWRGGI